MVQTRFIQLGEVRLQYFEHGQGPETLVLVHGYQTSGRIWKLTQEAMDPEQYRTIAISNRGAGDSDRGTSEHDYTVDAFAGNLFQAIQTLGVEDFALVGHSMGGATVARFALDHPELLKALVLMNSAPLGGRPLAEDWEAQIRAQFAQGTAQRLNFGAKTSTLPADFVRALEADVARNPVERAIGGRRSMSQLRLREQLHHLPMPVLVVGGDRDTTVGVENILAEYLALPTAQRSLHIYHGVGHSPNVEVPVELAALLGTFVSQVAATVRRGA
jgi:branched-chain amino acid transport system permease protein